MRQYTNKKLIVYSNKNARYKSALNLKSNITGGNEIG